MPYGYVPQTNLERRALRVATIAHGGQKRKGSDYPYIVHPINVALLLQQAGESSERIATGLLHDVLEDAKHKYSRHQMRQEFGYDITNTVLALTKDERIKDWRQRNEAYLDHIASTQYIGALSVCAADKLSNISDTLHDYEILGDNLWTRFNAGKEDQLWWYQNVHNTLERRIPNHVLVQKLGQKVILLEHLIKPWVA